MNSEMKSAARASARRAARAEGNRRELDFPKSSAHALAQTLVSRGYVVQDSNERYALAESCRNGFSGRAREAHLIAIARPIMEALRDSSGETVMLCVRAPPSSPARPSP